MYLGFVTYNIRMRDTVKLRESRQNEKISISPYGLAAKRIESHNITLHAARCSKSQENALDVYMATHPSFS